MTINPARVYRADTAASERGDGEALKLSTRRKELRVSPAFTASASASRAPTMTERGLLRKSSKRPWEIWLRRLVVSTIGRGIDSE